MQPQMWLLAVFFMTSYLSQSFCFTHQYPDWLLRGAAALQYKSPWGSEIYLSVSAEVNDCKFFAAGKWHILQNVNGS